MPLDYADFAHHYEGQELTETEKRTHFESMVDLLECIARLFWRDNAHPHSLGINMEGISLRLTEEVHSNGLIIIDIFNTAASPNAARKQDS